MTPDRKHIIGDVKITEYYWVGKMVVYVNNRAFEGTYKEALEKAQQDLLKEVTQ